MQKSTFEAKCRLTKIRRVVKKFKKNKSSNVYKIKVQELKIFKD